MGSRTARDRENGCLFLGLICARVRFPRIITASKLACFFSKNRVAYNIEAQVVLVRIMRLVFRSRQTCEPDLVDPGALWSLPCLILEKGKKRPHLAHIPMGSVEQESIESSPNVFFPQTKRIYVQEQSTSSTSYSCSLLSDAFLVTNFVPRRPSHEFVVHVRLYAGEHEQVIGQSRTLPQAAGCCRMCVRVWRESRPARLLQGFADHARWPWIFAIRYVFSKCNFPLTD